MSRITYNGKTLQYGGKSLNIPPVETIFDDWFLPSRNELTEMYTNLHAEGIGDFTAANYWSSSEINSLAANSFTFEFNVVTESDKFETYKVRACRTFISVAGTYNLRDVGPSGGLIFYITAQISGDELYYEAAPSDQSASQAWSNVTSALIGTTGTSIGTGQQNTLDIINQVGHTDSAAKLCDDLVI